MFLLVPYAGVFGNVEAQEEPAETNDPLDIWSKDYIDDVYPWGGDDAAQFKEYHTYETMKLRMLQLAEQNPDIFEFHEGMNGGVNARGETVTANAYEGWYYGHSSPWMKITADVDGGAYFRYWFTITMNDGRTFGYDNTGPNMMSSNAFAALFRLNVYIVCPSSLEGDVVATSTEVGAWSGIAGGFTLAGVTDELVKSGPAENVYTMKNDNTLGGWGPNGANYSVPTASGPEITDACNVLTYSGADDYSETWSLVDGSVSVSADSKTLFYTWENTYGESAAVELTYADGSSWPALTN